MVRQARYLLVDPGEREEVIVSSVVQGPAALGLSLVLHAAVLFFAPALVPVLASPEREDTVMTVELLHSVRQRIRREKEGVPRPSDTVSAAWEKYLAGLAGSDAVPARIAADGNADLDRVRGIRSAIHARWEATDPPGQGSALVLLHVGQEGRLIQTWVRALEGEPVFQQYMQSFLASLVLTGNSGEELWLECEFVVK